MDRLPPGPRSVLLQTLRFTRDNLGYLTRCLRAYGDPFTVRMLHTTYVITGDPEEARRIFTADPETFGPSAGEEARFLLATILKNYRLTLLETGPVRHVLRSASLGAETGIRMRFDGRRDPARRTSPETSASRVPQ